MFASVLKFELRYWFRGWMVFIFAIILAALFFGAASSDNIVIGGAIENTNRNAPFVIQNYFAIGSILTLLMTTAFASAAATRDFAYQTNQIVFSTPLRKTSFLLGRFFGSSIAAIFPMVGISIGILLASIMPWNEPERWGANTLAPHVMGFLVFAIPNTLATAAIIFSIAAVTRSSTFAFISAIGLLIGYALTGSLISNLDNEQLAMLLDPLGVRPFSRMTRYWTIAERNTMTQGLSGTLLVNRILWLGAAGVVFGFAVWRFSFSERTSRRKRLKTDAPDSVVDAGNGHTALPVANISASGAATWQLIRAQLKIDLRETVQSRVFLILLTVSVLNLTGALFSGATEGYGNSSLPVTYSVIEIIRGATYLFLISIITFYCGVVVWKERESKLDEVYDAMPYPTWTTYVAKLLAMLVVVFLFLLLSIGVGVLYQASQGYQRFQFALYGIELLLLDFLVFAFLTVLAMACHIFSPNKYVGYFAFIVCIIANSFVWYLLDWSTLLVQYGSLPSYVYSDFYGFKPYVQSLSWLGAYWIAGAALLAIASILFWQRGKETRVRQRIVSAKQRWTRPLAIATGINVVVMAGLGGWIYYNTQVVNQLQTSDGLKDQQAAYERSYRQYVDLPQPRITRVAYEIDLFPEQRSMKFHGKQTIENKHPTPIDAIHFVLSANLDTEIELPGSSLTTYDEDLNYRIYTLESPMLPGESREMEFTVSYSPKGFEQTPSVMQVMPNGTFFNNGIAPQIGYQPDGELSVRSDRRKRGLGEPHRMAALEADCSMHCSNTYISNNSDWVDVETVISTSSDQIAIAPGSLVREWEEDGRRYFQYRLDQPSLNFYSFMSAEYKVAREKMGEIDIEVYYHPEHEWNVPKMVDAIRKSMEYYTENFGPYRHNQARIIEFPRYASFAQAFPGTMPYSEGIGFIADLEDEDSIDMVYYVVAHEMAHQWWAHQVVGARMEGATLLSETLAQYSALMVMEHAYGRDMMRKFLRYEMDSYLRSRGSDALKEEPLTTVDASQGYVHYRKGSVVLYYLKEMIGENKVNAALQQLVEKFAYKGPPYPTSLDLIAALRDNTPPDQWYLLTDLFERITLFDNRTTDATYRETDDGKYEVTLTFETKKLASNADGEEEQVEMMDYVEIGAFAKPEPGRKYGKTLHRERLQLKAGTHTHSFTLDELPHEAGVDPFALLVDRVLDDNLSRVTAE
jgi:ABC-2 type transport system permease protein